MTLKTPGCIDFTEINVGDPSPACLTKMDKLRVTCIYMAHPNTFDVMMLKNKYKRLIYMYWNFEIKHARLYGPQCLYPVQQRSLKTNLKLQDISTSGKRGQNEKMNNPT